MGKSFTVLTKVKSVLGGVETSAAEVGIEKGVPCAEQYLRYVCFLLVEVEIVVDSMFAMPLGTGMSCQVRFKMSRLATGSRHGELTIKVLNLPA